MIELLCVVVGAILGFCLGILAELVKSWLYRAHLCVSITERSADCVIRIRNTKNIAHGIFLNVSSCSPLNMVYLYGSAKDQLPQINVSTKKTAIFARLDTILLLNDQQCEFMLSFIKERENMPAYLDVVASSQNSNIAKCHARLTWELHRQALGTCTIHSDKARNQERILRLRFKVFEAKGDKPADELRVIYRDLIERGPAALDEQCKKHGILN